VPELYPHQETGVDFLARRGFAFLWDEPGAGKTPQVVCACDAVGARKVLVVAPSAVRQQWAEEFETWGAIKRPVTVEEGYVTERPGDGVTIVSHASLADEPPSPKSRQRRREVYSWPTIRDGGPYDVVVLDEGDAFRDYNALRARNFYMPGGLFSQARQTWTLTGTPLVNSAADLWLPVFGPIGDPISWWDWCNRYAEMKPDAYEGMKPVGIRDARGLAEFLRPHVLRRTLKSVGVQLPPLEIRPVAIPVNGDTLRAAMAGLEGWTPERVRLAMENGDELRDAALSRVRQALGIAKVPFAAGHIAGILEQGDGPVVAFFQHTEVRKMLFDILRSSGFVVSWIDGKVTRAQLRAAKDWFQAGRIDVLLVQTQAGGVGLNLVRSHRAVTLELPWTSVALEQSHKRVHRIGQMQPCTAEVLRASDCWLENILASVTERKRKAADELLSLLTTGR
jgi:hypothetical protein